MRKRKPIQRVFTPREVEHLGDSVRLKNGNYGEVDGRFIIFLETGSIRSIDSVYQEIRTVRNENGQVIAKRVGKWSEKLWAVENAYPHLMRKSYSTIH